MRLIDKNQLLPGYPGYAPAKKLSELEDAEEFCEKLESQGYFYRKYVDTKEIARVNYEDSIFTAYNFKEKQIFVFCNDLDDVLKVEEYGKTWAFTKEELL